MRCVIISGGTVTDLEWLRGKIKKDDRVICADGGADYAAALGIIPHVIVGDMDSVHPAGLESFSRQGTELKKHPTAKNETDTALALAEALSGEPEEIVIFGATGTRLDHTLANIHLLRTAALKGIPARLSDEHNEITLVVPGRATPVRGMPGETFSLLPLTARVTGIEVRGARWPLENAVFEIGDPYGISNQLASRRADVSIRSGLLLLIRVREQDNMSNPEITPDN